MNVNVQFSSLKLVKIFKFDCGGSRITKLKTSTKGNIYIN